MNAPQIQEEELHAFVDGQLPKERCRAVLAYLGHYPHEIVRLAAYATQKEELRRQFEAIEVPSASATTAELERALAGRLSGSCYREWLRRVAAIAGLVVIGWWSNTFYQQHLAERLPDVVVEAAQAHQIFGGDVRRPVELTAAASADMVAWFSSRLGEHVEIPSLGTAGLRLVGGRLLAGDEGPVAQLIYEHEDGHRLTLGVSAEPADSGAEIEVVTFEGLTAGYWLEGALTYALVGKTSEAQLVAIATRIGADQPRGWL
jgi:anti-sigma factor RsiW